MLASIMYSDKDRKVEYKNMFESITEQLTEKIYNDLATQVMVKTILDDMEENANKLWNLSFEHREDLDGRQLDTAVRLLAGLELLKEVLGYKK